MAKHFVWAGAEGPHYLGVELVDAFRGASDLVINAKIGGDFQAILAVIGWWHCRSDIQL
jgi:hypothetical protein